MKKFYLKKYKERLQELIDNNIISKKDENIFENNYIKKDENVVENYISSLSIPVGILRNIFINNKSYTVPMATEEPSVIAAANNGSKFFENITAELIDDKKMGQIIILNPGKKDKLENFISENYSEIMKIANNSKPNIVKRGGGLREIVLRQENNDEASLDFFIDSRDAMGANIINSILENVSSFFKENNFDVLAAIVSNNNDRYLVKVKAESKNIDEKIGKRIQYLSNYAKKDPYRAATDNKGMLNGASSVVVATGNDFRAFETAVHVYASKDGKYKSLTNWEYNNNKLIGELILPISFGTVGGTIKRSDLIKANLNLISKNNDLVETSYVVASVALVQNFSALKAIVGEGIQSGHMKMQKRFDEKNNE